MIFIYIMSSVSFVPDYSLLTRSVARMIAKNAFPKINNINGSWEVLRKHKLDIDSFTSDDSKIYSKISDAIESSADFKLHPLNLIDLIDFFSVTYIQYYNSINT